MSLPGSHTGSVASRLVSLSHTFRNHTFRNKMATKPIVVVTGASGYAAGHVCKRLVESQKYTVRGAVRSKSKAKTGYLESIGVEVYEGCDLMKQGSFDRVLEGARYVHHM